MAEAVLRKFRDHAEQLGLRARRSSPGYLLGVFCSLILLLGNTGEGKPGMTRDGEEQAPAGSLRKKIPIRLCRLDLRVEDFSQDAGGREGTYLSLNRDDDDENGTLDGKQTGNVPGEDDLLRITLSAGLDAHVEEAKDSKVTLRAAAGRQRIRVWREKNKVAEISLPAAFPASELPKLLWVEGIQVSGKLRDVELKLESNRPVCSDAATLTVLSADLDVDTDRDGIVHDEKDETGEEEYTRDRGAIFSVNYDRNGARTAAGLPLPDAIHFDGRGMPVEEDKRIENDADLEDIAPLLVRRIGLLPPGTRVFLKAAEREDIQSIHIYGRRAAAERAIWGSLGDRVTGGAAEPTEKEITAWVKLERDAELGVEGLFFQSNGTINPFNGEIDITLELRKDGRVLSSDTVRMKVVPWLMIPHSEKSREVWTGDWKKWNEPFRLNAKADAGYVGLDNSGQLKTESDWPTLANSQWLQDHIEVGYTQRPGASARYCMLRLPRHVPPSWPQLRFLGPGRGIFQFGGDSGADSGDSGGNLEVLPPTATHKLGRILVGDTRSKSLMDFLTSQEGEKGNPAQAPVEVPTKWLSVGHVDEVFALTGKTEIEQAESPMIRSAEVAIADPGVAYALLDSISPIDRGRAVFFATGAAPESGVASAGATANTRLETGLDHRGTKWEYIRIFEDSGSGAAGQVAHIKTRGDGYIEIDKVWKTTSHIISPAAGIPAIRDYMQVEAPASAVWAANPKKADRYVLVEGTRFWYDRRNPPDYHGTPAIVTVAEVLRDANLAALNKTDAQGQIAAVRSKLEAASSPAELTFVKVPVIYVGRRAGFVTGRSAVAFTPNLANVQVVSKGAPIGERGAVTPAGLLYFPRQFGPRNSESEDIFEKETRSHFASALFVDDWDMYHRRNGGVHCGTVTIRDLPRRWWTNQP